MGHDVHDHDHPHDHDHADRRVPEEHRATAPTQVAVQVITCSDTRSEKSDESGRAIREGLEQAGHLLVGHVMVKDDAAALKQAIAQALAAGVRAVLITGGTGIARRDVTVEVVGSLLEKKLDGFGELFRMLSFAEIGSAAMLSRAVAGTYQGALLFALPGSPGAVKLALHKLILPELGHAVRELMR
jgi:molybdenum cofactor biosynthesis protein B